MLSVAYLSTFLDNGAVIEWGYSSKPDHVDIHYSLDGINLFPVIVGLNPAVTKIVVDKSMTGGNTWFILHISSVDTTGKVLNTFDVSVNIQNASGKTATPVAMDENGNAKTLRTDQYGNLLVTALTLDSPGAGDASSANQTAQITVSNAIKSAVDSVKDSVDGISTKLNDVRINTSQVLDLKTVSIQNFPTDYADAASRAVLDSISSKVATESSLLSIIAALSTILKKSDLSITAGVQNVNVASFPVDYPSLDTSTKLQQISNLNTEILGAMLSSSDKLSDITNLSESTDSKIFSILSSMLSYLNTYPAQYSNDLQLCKQTLYDILSRCASSSDIDRVITELASTVKKSDLPIVDGSFKTTVDNLPSDYPDNASALALSNLKTSLDLIHSDILTNRASPIPAGTNNIGSVNVSASALPSGASTEATLVSLYNIVSAFKAEIASISSGSIKNKLTTIIDKLTELTAKVEDSIETEVLYSTSANILPSATISTGSLTNTDNSVIVIGAACDPLSGFKLSVLTSDDSVVYFPIKGYNRVLLEGGVYHLIKIPTTMKYIRVDITNSSNATTVDAMYLTVKKE